jgi:hypothetical protein
VGKVKRVLRAAEKGGNAKPRGRRPLWATEFWWVSDPPGRSSPPIVAPVRKHARWIEEALYLFWKKGVKAAFYYGLRDLEGTDLPTGLIFADGTPKPALQAFRFPFVTHRRTPKKVRAWGKAPSEGTLEIQRLRGDQWRTIKRLSVRKGSVFHTRLHLRGKTTLRAQVGGEQSLDWQQSR